MKADVCDVCGEQTKKYYGSFFTEYKYGEEHGYPRKGPSDELELCRDCRDILLSAVWDIRRRMSLD